MSGSSGGVVEKSMSGTSGSERGGGNTVVFKDERGRAKKLSSNSFLRFQRSETSFRRLFHRIVRFLSDQPQFA